MSRATRREKPWGPVSREDLSQNAWVAALTALPRWDPRRASLRTFLSFRLRGSILDLFKRWKGGANATMDVERMAAAPPKGESDALLQLRVKECLATLPGKQRTALILKYWYGLRGSEAAELLGMTTAAYWTLVYEAHNRFRFQWKEIV